LANKAFPLPNLIVYIFVLHDTDKHLKVSLYQFIKMGVMSMPLSIREPNDTANGGGSAAGLYGKIPQAAFIFSILLVSSLEQKRSIKTDN